MIDLIEELEGRGFSAHQIAGIEELLERELTERAFKPVTVVLSRIAARLEGKRSTRTALAALTRALGATSNDSAVRAARDFQISLPQLQRIHLELRLNTSAVLTKPRVLPDEDRSHRC